VSPAAMAWPPPAMSRPLSLAASTAAPRSTPEIERPEPLPMPSSPSATTMTGRCSFSFSLPATMPITPGCQPGAATRATARFDWPAESVFVVYALAGVAMLGVYATMSPEVEMASHASPATPLGPSKRIVYQLAALFSLDSFAGGFAVQSLLVLWLLRRHHFTVGKAGVVLAAMQILSAASGFVAVRIERRIGPLRTMVFTHLPGQIMLIAAAFAPSARLAVGCLIARSLVSSMDVPVRNAFVMSVVTPPERAAAASVTNVPRSLASAIPPLAAGWMLDQTTFGWPLIIAGVLKIVYDLLMLRMARTRDREATAV